MKDAYYFSHDSNARNDPKIQALMSKWNYEGYGWYWAVLETLREQPGYKYPNNKYTFDTFARILCTTREIASEFLSDCCHEFCDEKGGLLCIDESFLWSESFLSRMATIDEKRDKARDSIKKRWANNERNTNVIRTNNERTTDVIQGKERKGKERRVKDSDITSWNNPDAEPNGEFVRLTPDEWKTMTEELGIERAQYMVDRLNGYIGQKGKAFGVKTYKSHKSTMMNWHRKDVADGKYTTAPQRSRYREVD